MVLAEHKVHKAIVQFLDLLHLLVADMPDFLRLLLLADLEDLEVAVVQAHHLELLAGQQHLVKVITAAPV